MTDIAGIRVLERRRGNVFFQWQEEGRLRRGWLRERTPGWVPGPDDVMVAAPYGDPFEDVLPDVRISPEALADALRRKGVWTADEASANPQAIVHAIVLAAGLSYSMVQSAIAKLQEM